MKRYPMPAQFDGEKFARRYGLDAFRGDFCVDADGMLCVPDNLPDDPPIFEAPDAPKPSVQERLNNVKTLPDLITLLKERL